MTTNILKQTIQENSNGVEKGSSKRVIAYLFTLAIIFLCVYPVCKGEAPPLELIGMLIGNLLLLLGITAYHASINPPKKADPVVPPEEGAKQ